MAHPKAQGLADHLLVRCGQCGAPIWSYTTPAGHAVALDDADGPYVVDGSTAYKTTTNLGYRGHWDHCKRIARAPLSAEIVTDEFIWAI